MFSGREAGPLQWPFVGLAVLLILLIVTTPSLLGVGTHSAGAPNTSPELVVYRSAHGAGTSFALTGVEITGYKSLRISTGPLPRWPYTGPIRDLMWSNWSNATDSISTTISANATWIAVNATAVFEDLSGGIAVYQGVYAFNVTATTIYLTALTPTLSPGTPSLAVVDLPEPLPLLEVSTTP